MPKTLTATASLYTLAIAGLTATITGGAKPVTLELKRLSINARQSEETICYNADVYIDGKKSFTAENNGTGGSDNYRPLYRDKHLSIEDSHAEIRAMEALAKKLPPAYFGEGDSRTELSFTLELLIGQILESAEFEKVRKKFVKDCSDKTLFRLPKHREGEYMVAKTPFNEASKAHWLKKYPDALFYNEMDLATLTQKKLTEIVHKHQGALAEEIANAVTV